MPKNILMPALSPTMEEGNLVKWLKLEGEKIKDGEVIAEIETDKATMEVESTDDGVLAKILIPEGTEGVKVNTPIAVMTSEGESFDASKAQSPAPQSPSQSQTAPEDKPAPAPVEAPKQQCTSKCTDARIFATPLAKRIAGQNGINLSEVSGTGPRGRITKCDVESALGSKSNAPRICLSSIPASRDMDGLPEYDLIKLNGMRKTIAKRLVESKHNSPHFYVTIDCEIDELMKARKRINEAEGIKLTLNDFIIKAVAKTLINVPKANASWFEDGIHMFKTADVSVAVAIEDGLITPIIKSAEHKGLLQISTEMKDLAGRARDGKLKPEEFKGGTFTISNMGMYGISSFMAIINPPHGCIMAVGAGIKKPVVKNDAVALATVMNCTLSVDHRVVDGAVAAAFMAEFKKNIENPSRMLL